MSSEEAQLDATSAPISTTNAVVTGQTDTQPEAAAVQPAPLQTQTPATSSPTPAATTVAPTPPTNVDAITSVAEQPEVPQAPVVKKTGASRLQMRMDRQREMMRRRKEKMQAYYNMCMRTIIHSINIINAVFMRLMFSLVALIAIVFVYLIKQDEWYFVNVIGVIFIFIELFITIVKRRGKEPQRYSSRIRSFHLVNFNS